MPEQWRNPDLYNALKEYFKAVCDHLSAQFKSPEDLINTVRNLCHPFLPPPSEDLLACVAYTFYLGGRIEWVEQKEYEYDKVIEVMEKDEQLARHFNASVKIPEVGEIHHLGGVVDHLVVAFIGFLGKLSSHRYLKFDESTFNEFYEEFENFYYGETIEYWCYAPLYNFRTDAENIPLEEPNLLITKNPSIKMRRPEILLLYYIGLKDIWAIEYRCKTHKVLGNKLQIIEGRRGGGDIKIKEEFDEVCSALRLFKGGLVSYNSILKTPVSWTPFRGRPWERPGASRLDGGRYELQNDEVREFLDFWEQFKKARQTLPRYLEVALRRFNLSYERERLDDKLIDLMIGFEALLLKEREELSYRLALRASRLLGEDASEREKIFDDLRKAYDQRNKIVHGGEVDTSELPTLVPQVEDYLRSAIKTFLKRVDAQGKQDPKKQILKALDNQIVRGD